jgi:hypothetical protein
METCTFAAASCGERLLAARDGRELAKKLSAAMSEGASHLVIDLEGVVAARPIAMHHLLRTARKLLQPHYPDATLEVVNAAKKVRSAFERALGERHDFLVERLDEEIRLRVSHPAFVSDEHGTRRIGTRRRQMLAVIARDGSECVWCGLGLAYDHPKATLDHVRPQSKDGSDKIGNLLLACDDCNYARKNRSAGQWLQLCLKQGQTVNLVAVAAARKRVKRTRVNKRPPLASPASA